MCSCPFAEHLKVCVLVSGHLRQTLVWNCYTTSCRMFWLGFKSGANHSFIVGFVVAASLMPFIMMFFEQIGHPFPTVRLLTSVRHSCPSEHSHQIFLLDFGSTSAGVSLLFFVGCHSEANVGLTVSKSFSPLTGSLPEQ